MSNRKVFIVHGWTYNLDKWDDVMNRLSECDVEPVMLNVPGLSVPSQKVWDIDSYVEWLNEQICDEQDPIIIGHSNGGRIAMAYESVYPSKIAHLFLISSAGIYHDDKKVSAKRRAAGVVAKLLKPIARGRVRRVLYRLIGGADYGNASENMRKTMTNVINYDKVMDVTKVKTPVTMIWGENDALTPIEDAYKIKDQLTGDVDLHILHDSGHSPQADYPQQVADIIVKKLESF